MKRNEQLKRKRGRNSSLLLRRRMRRMRRLLRGGDEQLKRKSGRDDEEPSRGGKAWLGGRRRRMRRRRRRRRMIFFDLFLRGQEITTVAPERPLATREVKRRPSSPEVLRLRLAKCGVRLKGSSHPKNPAGVRWVERAGEEVV